MDWKLILECFYACIGFLLILCGVIVLKDEKNEARIGGFLFWSILGFIFITGGYLKYLMPEQLANQLIGVLVIVLATLSAFKQIRMGQLEVIAESFRTEQAQKLGNLIFIPSIVIAFFAFAIAQFLPKFMPANVASLAGLLGIGISSLLGLIITMILTRSSAKNIVIDSSRLIRQMGATSILPQLLAALGAIFTAAGVGTVISHLLVQVIPQGNILIGVIMYCLGMVLFTMIMGNAFAAFSLITVGIGIPFVINQGANPAIACALALTVGYCGTLLTPMAANFNIVPANLLETKGQYTVIKYQVPFALIMIVVHIALMYFLPFAF